MSTTGFQPREAFVALRKLLEDPDDTEQAFKVVRAIDAGGIDRVHARMRSTPEGRALLRDRPSLLAALRDRDALMRMPEGSLGRAYAAFCDREGITPGGLVEASESTRGGVIGEELLWLSDRLRDSHDLWHVVTGCRTDLAGELQVLAFSAAQTDGLGVGLLAATGFLRSFALPRPIGLQARRMVIDAFTRGRRAAWLPSARWEALLPMPLDEVRIELGLTSIPVYRPLYPADLPIAA